MSDFLEPMSRLGPMMMASPNGCTENGRHYAVGEQIPTLERCKHCYCGLDGLKECKMIECSLKVAHNCVPVTPEGHCCPIRYECPSNATATAVTTNGQQSLQAARQRFRSETGISNGSGAIGTLQELISSPFAGVKQCKSSNGADDCSSNQTSTSTTTTILNRPVADDSGLANGLEHIRGLSVADDSDGNAGVVSTTAGQGGPLGSMAHTHADNINNNNNHDSSRLFNGNSSANRNDSLTEELNKFIMQIQANGSSANFNSLEQQLSAIPTATPRFNPPMTTVSSLNGASGGGNSLDYHTVQPPEIHLTQPPPIPTGMMGIPSIEPESNNGSNLFFEQPPSTSAPVDLIGPTTGVRDSRSADNLLPTFGTRFNDSSINADLGFSLPESNLNGTEGWIGLSMSGRANTSSPVVFDDESALNRTNLNKRLVDEFSGYNLSSALANNTSNELDDDSQPPSTPLPPQPTTGTPIGLEADRTPETRSWLKSLSGIVQSFGRRLNGPNSGFGEGLQGAASDGNRPDNASQVTLQRNQSLAANQPIAGRSARQHTSILDQLLASMIGAPASSDTVTSRTGQMRTSGESLGSNGGWQPLVMRPLASLLSTPSVVAPVQRPSLLEPGKSLTQIAPYEPMQTGHTERIEIVTAAVPGDPDVFEHARAEQIKNVDNMQVLVGAKHAFTR